MQKTERANLLSHRTSQSVWDKRGWSGPTIEERLMPWALSVGGAALVVAGASRRSWYGAPFVVTGAVLIGCVAAGLCNPRELGVRLRHAIREAHDADQITIEAMDSFPASDAPSSNATASRLLAGAPA